MKKLIPIIAVFAAVIGLAAYLVVSLGAKNKYDKTRTELADHVLSEAPMDAETKALLTEVRTSWIETTNEIGGPHTGALKTLGWEPSVSSLIDLMTYRMPEYSLLALGRNRRPMQIGTVQAVLIPISTDKSIHVSDDRQVALIRHSPTMVSVFQNEEDGLREIQYHLKKQENVESAVEGDAAKSELHQQEVTR